jgi:osmotically inducible lipoprotein OsmB
MKPLIALVFTSLLLGACGTATGDRGLSGAGIGAGIGIIGGPPGMLVGGAVGAAVGMATKPSTVNLGKPAWK